MGVSFEKGVYYEESIYFWGNGSNCFGRIDLKDSFCEVLSYDKQYGIDKKRLYGAVEGVGEKLYFAPMSAENILVVNRNDFGQKKLSIDVSSYIHANPNEKFFASCCVKDKIFFVGSSCHCILQVNPILDTIDVFDEWKDDFSYSIQNHKDLFISVVKTPEDTLLAPASYENKVLEFVPDNCDWRVYTVPECENGFSGICFDGENYWLSPMEGNTLIKWNKDSNVFTKVELPYNYGGNSVQYGGCLFFNGAIITQKSWRKEAIVIRENKDGVDMETIGIAGDDARYVEAYIPVAWMNCNNEKLIACDLSTGDLYRVTTERQKKAEKIAYDVVGTGKLFKGCELAPGNIITESDLFNLRFLIGQLIEE